MQTIQELAKSYLKHFTFNKRDNGETFVKLKDNAPEELKDIVFNAHGRMFPDDYVFEYVHAAFEMFADYDSPEDAISSIEADCYTSDLLAWVSSHHRRVGYVDEQVQELGHSDGGMIGDIMQGQVYERADIANSVLSALQDILDDMAA